MLLIALSYIVGTGAGAATTVAYAAAAAKHIILNARRLKPLRQVRQCIKSQYPSTEVTIQSCHISDTSTIDSLLNAYFPIHIVAQCAGYLEGDNKIIDGDFADFWPSSNVNIKGVCNLATASLDNTSFKEGDEPVFIGFNSLLAHLPGTQFTIAPASYAVSKITAAKLMEYLSSENRKFKAYALHPGIIRTKLSLKSLEMAPEGFDPNWDDVDVPAHCCVWLSSKEGKSTVPSGTYLCEDWDVEELKERKKQLGGVEVLSRLV